MRRAGRYIIICAVVAASGFNEMTDFDYLSSQSVGSVPSMRSLIPSVTVCDAATETDSAARWTPVRDRRCYFARRALTKSPSLFKMVVAVFRLGSKRRVPACYP
jgi:hypothetical protein